MIKAGIEKTISESKLKNIKTNPMIPLSKYVLIKNTIPIIRNAEIQIDPVNLIKSKNEILFLFLSDSKIKIITNNDNNNI